MTQTRHPALDALMRGTLTAGSWTVHARKSNGTIYAPAPLEVRPGDKLIYDGERFEALSVRLLGEYVTIEVARIPKYLSPQ